MLAVFAVAVSMAVKPCQSVAGLETDELQTRLEQAAVSPPSVRRVERACLAAAASQRLGRYRAGALPSTITPALAKALDAVLPGVAPALALGRSNLFEGLAVQLQALTPLGRSRDRGAWSVTPIDQSEQGFLLWLRVEPQRTAQAQRFEAYLHEAKVEGIAPVFQILRTASDWQACGGEPFALPPPRDWPRAARALAWIRDRVKPAVGEIEVMSGFREPELNACAEGARESAHLGFWALDLEPFDPRLTRTQLMQALCQTHKRYGQGSDIGLGFYAGVRFHVDAKRYRHWGFDPVAAPACAANALP